MQTSKGQVRALLAPEGRLKVAINYGNPVLAQRREDGEPGGVSAALARALAAELDVAVAFVTYEAAGAVVADLEHADWRLAFLARDPKRAETIHFTSPYVLIEGTYLVPEAAPFAQVDELDRDGVRIAVGEGAAYDLYLSRTLQHAELVRAPTSAAAIERFVEQGLDAAAGVRQPLTRYAEAHPGYRVLPGRFTAIEQCMALPRAQAEVADYVEAFLARMKHEGMVQRALSESGQGDAEVAP
ncbi:transporter substrate-binding domain-containing protein [Salinicola endophyticus]|uniref:Transporter substrate-binding domain-containing protein n=1 Tax=Salinicola endophyticus TaxID=1949083 RepID=A0ABY8FCW4_9GAMM|nr:MULTISPECIES: transporter substrate-binding domain-containing protein [Salinicola]WFF40636.1 transporter substrate-binding domain-containing protein [Salinicola endophyticus]